MARTWSYRIQPGGQLSFSTPDGDAYEVYADACPPSVPRAGDDDDGGPWPFPDNVAALRIGDRIVGAVSSEIVRGATADVGREQLRAAGLSAKDVDSVATLDQLTDALASRREEVVRVLVPPGKVRGGHHDEIAAAVERSGGEVEFLVPRDP